MSDADRLKLEEFAHFFGDTYHELGGGYLDELQYQALLFQLENAYRLGKG